MRCTLRMLIGTLVLLAGGVERAAANGLLVIPLEVFQTVAVPTGEHQLDWINQVGPDGRVQLVPVYTPLVTYQQVKVPAYGIVPNPKKPCYRPPPPPPPPLKRLDLPSPQAPSKTLPQAPSKATPQAPPAAPAPASASTDEGHEHDEEKGGCGSCFPDCFVGPQPCTCCAHDVEVYERDSDIAKYYWGAINDKIIAYRLIRDYTLNADGTYTFHPLD